MFFALWAFIPALSSMVNLKGVDLRAVLSCEGVFGVVAVPMCRVDGPFDWLVYVLTLPIVDWIVVTVFIAVAASFVNGSTPAFKEFAGAYQSLALYFRGRFMDAANAVARHEVMSQAQFEAIGARLESVSNQVHDSVSGLRRSEMKALNAASTLSGIERITLLTTHRPSRVPRPSHMTLWIQGRHYGLSSLEVCMRVALELGDDCGFGELAAVHQKHGPSHQGSARGVHEYFFGPRPSFPAGELRLWVNNGGQYGTPAEHEQNLRTFLWIPLSRDTAEDNL